VIGDLPHPKHDTTAFYGEVNAMRFDRALDHLWMKVRGLNVYLEEVKPWEVAKKGDEEHLQEILAYAAASLTQIAHMLWPLLPTTSEVITKIFEGGSISAYKGVLFPKIYNHTPAPGTPKPAAPASQPEAPTDAAR
jgi:methionyl-tRNA synthetase